MPEDEDREHIASLSADECKNRLAAAEFDLHKIADRSTTGHHPNLNES
jgi:hypothetical protein